jgi:hypothetical protein
MAFSSTLTEHSPNIDGKAAGRRVLRQPVDGILRKRGSLGKKRSIHMHAL